MVRSWRLSDLTLKQLLAPDAAFGKLQENQRLSQQRQSHAQSV
jgi:hypothetical protein